MAARIVFARSKSPVAMEPRIRKEAVSDLFIALGKPDRRHNLYRTS
jgi:hypothetical protein